MWRLFFICPTSKLGKDVGVGLQQVVEPEHAEAHGDLRQEDEEDVHPVVERLQAPVLILDV